MLEGKDECVHTCPATHSGCATGRTIIYETSPWEGRAVGGGLIQSSATEVCGEGMHWNENLLQLLAYLDVCEVLQQLCRLLMLSTHLHNLCKQSTLTITGFVNQGFLRRKFHWSTNSCSRTLGIVSSGNSSKHGQFVKTLPNMAIAHFADRRNLHLPCLPKSLQVGHACCCCCSL